MAANDVTVSSAATPASTSGSAPSPFNRNAEAKRSPPDGRWIAFASPGVDNVQRLWRSPASGGPLELTKDLAAYFRWSRDGKRIYFSRGSDVWVLTLANGHERRLTRFSQQAGELTRYSLAVGEAHLYFSWAYDLGDLWVADVVSDRRE